MKEVCWALHGLKCRRRENNRVRGNSKNKGKRVVALRPLPARKILKAFGSAKKGSHLILKHPDGRLTVVPMHAREEIGRGLLRKIAFDAKVSPSQLIKLIEQDP